MYGQYIQEYPQVPDVIHISAEVYNKLIALPPDVQNEVIDDLVMLTRRIIEISSGCFIESVGAISNAAQEWVKLQQFLLCEVNPLHALLPRTHVVLERSMDGVPVTVKDFSLYN